MENINPWAAGAVVLAVILVFFAIRSRGKEGGQINRVVVPPADLATDEDIRKLAHGGKKIQAIKLYREKYNVGLKEAKEAVEALE
ncbi:ribosomal protein L7/L12 [Hahella ganghwensis]|uniref:ribosomal protein L7/L12 n=1 Tax=Hahella ganghwensis TaxID=286420 RepID=UPI0003698B39|nr:ribosomal protein L7/L12 [Hahella ganghwensis]